jgi:RNA polymerase sigma-70 factor (ECF subfamily)
MATTTPPDVSDEALAARRDVAGLYERYAGRMFAFVSSRGVAAHDLDDVLQELWVRVHNGLRSRPFSGHFSGWLFQVARNLLIDRARRPAALAELPADDPTADHDTPQVILTRREVFDQLERCLQRLDDRERALVRARAAGQGYDELCASLDVERNAAYKTFHRATARLAECMKRAGYEPGSGNDP